MARRNFTKKTQREALARSGGSCEAVGAWYGLEPGRRCCAPLSKGVEYDHIDLDANSKDNSLENCAAVCIPCHEIKTRTHDIPVAAKTLRQQDQHRGVRLVPVQKIKSGKTISTRTLKNQERERLPALPPRAMFAEPMKGNEP